MINNNPKQNKRVFYREIIALGIILISIAPTCFVFDNYTIGIDCAIWSMLTLIVILCFIRIYLQRNWE